MKIAYLAPELPALSATFVYNEVLQLEKIGTKVIPFSVHRSSSDIADPLVNALKKRVTILYEYPLWSVFQSHCRFLRRFPQCYFATIFMLLKDMIKLVDSPRISVGLAFRFFYAAKLADDLMRHRCHHIHVHFAHVPTDIAMYAAKLAGIGFSVTSHANDLFERGWLLPQKVDRSAFFGTISEFNQRFLEQKDVDVSKVEILRCGVDITQFYTREHKPLSAPVKVGVVGRLVEKKGIDTLIASIAILKQQQINVVLAIAGSGPLESELMSLAFDLGLDDDSVQFLGPLAHQDVVGFIAELDLFALPCKQDKNGDMDGIPVVLMEAMLTGIPVISTNLSGIPELVIDNESGLVVDPSDTEALARAIKKLINCDILRQRLITGAVSKVTTSFSLSGNVEKLNDLFHATCT
jgi:colanic acid/amylovoran biosynthesis glycosyltransferase